MSGPCPTSPFKTKAEAEEHLRELYQALRELRQQLAVTLDKALDKARSKAL